MTPDTARGAGHTCGAGTEQRAGLGGVGGDRGGIKSRVQLRRPRWEACGTESVGRPLGEVGTAGGGGDPGSSGAGRATRGAVCSAPFARRPIRALASGLRWRSPRGGRRAVGLTPVCAQDSMAGAV